jgi:hypothetical protein
MEHSLTQVFDRPVHGRECFAEVIREHLDLEQDHGNRGGVAGF